MKLYLTSYRIPVPDELFAMLPKSSPETKLAYIPNAKDYKSPSEYQESMEDVRLYSEQLGFSGDVVDLRMFTTSQALYEKLKAYDLIWVLGGNTFILRHEMRRSGFDSIIGKLLEAGRVYIGESAGAIVAGANLKGAEVADEPELAKELVWEGLTLADLIIAPHADSQDFPGYVDFMMEFYKGDKRLTLLNDNQALVIEGSQQKIVTGN
jgi:dipeptidase E